MTERNTYTQRECDRTVGWGTVPEEYKKPEHKPEDKDKDEDPTTMKMKKETDEG